MILKDAKVGKNLSMAWIDYKKAYDMVPHSWIKEVAKGNERPIKLLPTGSGAPVRVLEHVKQSYSAGREWRNATEGSPCSFA
jgi:hypothetical protein